MAEGHVMRNGDTQLKIGAAIWLIATIIIALI